MSTKLYKENLEGFLRSRAMTLMTKIHLQGLATVMMLISLLVVPVLAVKIFLVAMMVFMYFYFARRIKTVTPEEMLLLKEDEARQRA